MKYYCITNSGNKKIVGTHSQVQQAIYHCDIWDDDKFIDRVDFVKTDFEPITANAILMKKAKLTDLLSADIIGFSSKLLMSGKLKSILENNRKTGLQFCKSPVVYKNEMIEDYWTLNLYEVNSEFIDFNKSEIFLMDGLFDKIKKLPITNIEEYEKEKMQIDKIGYPSNIYIERFVLNDNLPEDFFVLRQVEGGVKYMVSEKLKQKIEEAGCTGIEFMPSELKLTEWLHGGEREKIYGKA
ncbi:hypothetical protein FVB9288_03304 [Flavobacterium sp. CECT 9288]|uniref:imm11 family protein n=1 Tax=Flavobacterium sp. CECT 9288 TaxID=2845819 RepID=UPI001E509D82|nr:DUF1629 domain-containing protein [Flavobacterium sp. CECT 9288]CAH0337537.1 hypothetical protein FVB9288_03304 [Flavobacterium sp. CECT 9288]